MINNSRKYIPLLCAFAALFLLFPLSSLFWEPRATEVVLLVVMLVSIFTTESRAILRCLSVFVALPTYAVLWLNYDGYEPIAHFTAILLYCLAFRAILLDILRRTQITVNVVCGAIVLYCLIGIVWGHLYLLIDVLESTPSFSKENIPVYDYFYFSYVSLTTLGFGDLTPISVIARGFTIFEALVGQVFLAVFIAILVGRISSSFQSARGQETGY